MKAKIITITNQKGGVGKTTTAVNLAYYLNHIAGKRCLLVDVDPQINSSDTYRAKTVGESTLYDLLLGDDPIDEAAINETIQHTQYGDILPGDANLTEADDELHDVDDRFFALKDVLEKVDKYCNYDYIVLDTNPSLNTLLQCALTAADYTVLPCRPVRYAVQGLSGLSNTIVRAQRERNPKLKVAGILPVDYESRANVYRETLDQLNRIATSMGTRVFSTAIRRSSKVDEAQDRRMPLLAYAPKCNPALDYVEFGEELLKVIGGNK